MTPNRYTRRARLRAVAIALVITLCFAWCASSVKLPAADAGDNPAIAVASTFGSSVIAAPKSAPGASDVLAASDSSGLPRATVARCSRDDRALCRSFHARVNAPLRI